MILPVDFSCEYWVFTLLPRKKRHPQLPAVGWVRPWFGEASQANKHSILVPGSPTQRKEPVETGSSSGKTLIQWIV